MEQDRKILEESRVEGQKARWPDGIEALGYINS